MAIENMHIITIGCGSIGSRHAKNLLSLNVSLLTLIDPDIERAKALGDELSAVEIKCVASLDEALKDAQGINAAVIASPSSMHVEHALKCVQAELDILIEKPLSNSLDKLATLAREVKGRGKVAMMAMCYRFHPVFLRLKAIIDGGTLGRIYHVNYFGGHYLPDWHPMVDYRDEYAAKASLGGGVLLTSIHGLDNLTWLFGTPHEVAAYAEHVSDLDLDVEDMVASIMKTKNGIYISMYSDFLNRIGQHKMVITASLGTLECDFISGSIRLFSPRDRQWSEELIEFDINSMYVEELSYFLSCIGGDEPVSPDLDDGIEVLKLAQALKESGKEKKFITL